LKECLQKLIVGGKKGRAGVAGEVMVKINMKEGGRQDGLSRKPCEGRGPRSGGGVGKELMKEHRVRKGTARRVGGTAVMVVMGLESEGA
jgi:hypothetical protein